MYKLRNRIWNFGLKLTTMKHKNNKGEACVYRARKIYSLFQEIKRSGTCSTIGEICTVISQTRMDRYYISEERARDIYHRYRRHGFIEPCSRYAYALRLDLVHECERIRTESGLTSYSAIVREAIERPARSIGLSPNRIQRILKEGGLL